MEGFFGGLFSGIIGSVGDLAGRIKDALLTLWHKLVEAFTPVKAAWNYLEQEFGAFARRLEDLGMNVYRAIRHVVTYWIPHIGAYAIRKAVEWASAAIGHLKDWAIGALSTLRDWAASVIDALRQWAHDAVDYLTSRIGAAWDWIDGIGRKVADLVLHPAALAAYIFDPLWNYAWRHVRDQARPIGRWLLKEGLAASLGTAHVVEDVLTFLFL